MIQVKWFPTLVKRTRSKKDQTEVAWHAGLTPHDVFLAEGFSETDAEFVMAVVNDAQAGMETLLSENDRLEFLVSIQGGAVTAPVSR
ncbi:MAG: hypothetical protein LC118_18170 [Dehalococcoidia bacterium]|nr:hypothetical protein [Dehalococcoidia bacterium]